MTGFAGPIRRDKRRRRRNLRRPAAHPRGVMNCQDCREGGDAGMRTFVFVMVTLLVLALGALEVVASRSLPLP